MANLSEDQNQLRVLVSRARPSWCDAPLVQCALLNTKTQVEELFFNVSTRKKAMRNLNEEYQKILEVVTRYSIQFAGVSFTCKKVT